VRLTVRDTGTGMDVQTKELVFEPFFTTKPMGQGTGLGLSTVYGIVKQLNGSIWVDSEVGAGAAFHVFLPATVHGAVAAAEPVAETRATAEERSATVLLVEDEETVRRYAKAALEMRGLRVIVAATPEEALTAAATTEGPIALMLTDVVMPQMSGRELGELAHAARPDLAILYVSGYTDETISGRGLLAEEVNFLQKPFTAEDLMRKVREVLETRPRARRVETEEA
jgi:CheY-like chemotaxis protein